jgi:tellurite resistance protein TerA
MAGADLPALTAAQARRELPDSGSLRINMHWTPRTAPPATPGAVRTAQFDVDLGCLFELGDGSRGVVQSLGGLRGAFERAPFVQLDRDDRAGSAVGENLFVNLDRADRLRRVVAFVYAHNGPLAAARVWVDFHPAAGSGFRIDLEHVPADTHACAVALLTFGAGRVSVHREVRFVPGFQADVDRAYGFGLRWGRADKPGLR